MDHPVPRATWRRPWATFAVSHNSEEHFPIMSPTTPGINHILFYWSSQSAYGAAVSRLIPRKSLLLSTSAIDYFLWTLGIVLHREKSTSEVLRYSTRCRRISQFYPHNGTNHAFAAAPEAVTRFADAGGMEVYPVREIRLI